MLDPPDPQENRPEARGKTWFIDSETSETVTFEQVQERVNKLVVSFRAGLQVHEGQVIVLHAPNQSVQARFEKKKRFR